MASKRPQKQQRERANLTGVGAYQSKSHAHGKAVF